MKNLLGLDAEGLERFFEAQGEKPFRARQVLRSIIKPEQVVHFPLGKK